MDVQEVVCSFAVMRSHCLVDTKVIEFNFDFSPHPARLAA